MKKLQLLLLGTSLVFFAACGDAQTTTSTSANAEQKNEKTAPALVVSQTETPKGYAVGDIASDFSLKNVDEKMVSLASYEDAKGFVVIFTCNHCPYAIAYEDRIIDLDKKYKPLGYPVIAINPNDPSVVPDDAFDKMQERAKEKGFTFPYLFDEGQLVYPQYGATKTPHIYLLQKTEKGNQVAYIGAIDDNYSAAEKVEETYLANAIDALLQGKLPQPSTTKAIGCSIKKKS